MAINALQEDAEELLLTLLLNTKDLGKEPHWDRPFQHQPRDGNSSVLTTTQLLSQLSVLSLVLIRVQNVDPSLGPNIGLAAATLLFPLSVCMSSCIRLTLKISNTELPSSSNSSFLYRMRAAEIITYQNQNYFCNCSLLSLLQIFCLLIWGFLFGFGFVVVVLGVLIVNLFLLQYL